MKRNTLTAAIGAALFLTWALLGVRALPALAQNAKKTTGQKPQTKQTETTSEIKYKAQCGMIYSAADAKKYHYVCPMDHKPLVKITSSKAGQKKDTKAGSMGGMKM